MDFLEPSTIVEESDVPQLPTKDSALPPSSTTPTGALYNTEVKSVSPPEVQVTDENSAPLVTAA